MSFRRMMTAVAALSLVAWNANVAMSEENTQKSPQKNEVLEGIQALSAEDMECVYAAALTVLKSCLNGDLAPIEAFVPDYQTWKLARGDELLKGKNPVDENAYTREVGKIRRKASRYVQKFAQFGPDKMTFKKITLTCMGRGGSCSRIMVTFMGLPGVRRYEFQVHVTKPIGGRCWLIDRIDADGVLTLGNK